MSRTNGGYYEVAVDGAVVGKALKESKEKVIIEFRFTHEIHNCAILSHAYISDISMSHMPSSDEASSDAEPQDD